MAPERRVKKGINLHEFAGSTVDFLVPCFLCAAVPGLLSVWLLELSGQTPVVNSVSVRSDANDSTNNHKSRNCMESGNTTTQNKKLSSISQLQGDNYRSE